MYHPFHEAKQASPPSAPPAASMTRRAIGWLLHSGIRDASGGFSRYYRSDLEEFRPISTEITGYGISGLVYLYRLTGSEDCLRSAILAGHYLTHTAWDPPLATMPFECGPAPRRAYFFDLGIIARGLLALSRVSPQGEWLEVAAGCARSMASDFRAASGFHPVLSLPAKQPVTGDGRWSLNPGCYQLKAAMAWEDMETPFRPLYEGVATQFLDTHASFLDEEPERERVMDRLHAYCYFLEGLLPRAADPRCAGALRLGIRRAVRLLGEIRPVFERSDVDAQLLRLRVYCAAFGVLDVDAGPAAEEAASLGSFQYCDTDHRLDGGFSFGRKNGVLMPFVNPVSTIFAVQALEMWSQYLSGQFRAQVCDLI